MKRKNLLGLVAGAVALIVETLFALGCFSAAEVEAISKVPSSE